MLLRLLFVVHLLLAIPAPVLAADPLPSWNDGRAKQAILKFVRAATDQDSPHFVKPGERIATFDNDGTLWVEKPVYTQVVFALDRVRELAPRHPEWKTEQPFKTLLEAPNDAALADFSIQDFAKIVADTHTGITTSEFSQIVCHWLQAAQHPRFDRPYTELVYQPMLEVLSYLRASGFKTYIVTRGGQDFVRVFSDRIYGIPAGQVIGSAGKTAYEYDADGQPILVKQPEVFLIDDKQGKPEGIHLLIGQKPHAAFGNSTGDQQMLEWTQSGGRPQLMMLVHHDDAQREYAYGPDSKVGTFSKALMDEARERGWVVISMKNDWKRIFAFEELSAGE
ncbi:MAG: haloacid dehalogenase-like hydrolase [Planctomycetota bacterium]|nr:MAG: haloacid dehalogenase-like hydrolase [Planctomycetota bacterium]